MSPRAAGPPAISVTIARVRLPQLFVILTPILTVVGFLLWQAWGLGVWQSLLAGLGMGALPVLIVATLAWLERRRR